MAGIAVALSDGPVRSRRPLKTLARYLVLVSRVGVLITASGLQG